MALHIAGSSTLQYRTLENRRSFVTQRNVTVFFFAA
jgi:hypothetical protein